jgi:C1A family cysteine protease
MNTGYLIDQEDSSYLSALQSEEAVLELVGTYQEVTLDPRKLIRIEHQKNMGSCAGHSLSSNLEWIYCIQTGGNVIQLSRMQAYIMAQEIDNIRSDAGSTISAGTKLATTFGLAEESLWPYPSRYSRNRPGNWEQVKLSSAQHKITNTVRISSYEAWRTWLGSGQGGIHTGISWGGSMNRKVVESFSPGGGGHSVAALCLSDRKDSNGDCFSWIANSWGQSFGDDGWQEWSPNAIRQMLRHRSTVFVGLSDMPHVMPREISLDQIKKKLRV